MCLYMNYIVEQARVVVLFSNAGVGGADDEPQHSCHKENMADGREMEASEE